MTTELIRCPHCHMRVMPMADGTCTACRKNTQAHPSTEPSVSDASADRDEWEQYMESLDHSPADLIINSIREIEQPFLELRHGARDWLRGGGSSDNSRAERIKQELLPKYDVLIEQMHPAREQIGENLLTAVKMRNESWRVLAEMFSEDEPEKLERHNQLWEQSESLLGRPMEATSTASSVKRVQEFHRALMTLTPRLISTPAMVVGTVLVFVAMIASGVNAFNPSIPDAIAWGANFGPKTANGQWWRVVTCMFLHFGLVHLGFNMWVLWDLGRLVERLVGHVGFLVLYFVSGIAGSLASLTWNPLVVSGGASGAVFGVVGALLGLIALRRDTIPAPVLTHLWKSMGVFVVYNTIFGIIVPGIDMAAHLGGLVAGFGCGLVLSQPLSAERIARRTFRNAVLSVAGIVTLLVWAVALPNIASMVPPPSCTDTEVVKLLERVIRSTLVGSKLESVDRHREISFDADANVRHGECVAHTAAGDIPVKYVVEWQDVDNAMFRVRIPPAELPFCTAPEVVKLLERMLQGTLTDTRVNAVVDHREVRYDSRAEVRYGECIARTDGGDLPIKYLVEWQDREKGMFQVRVPPTELPVCTDPQVKQVLEQVIQDTLVGMQLISIDSHREVRYDADANVRYGECVVHTDSGDISVEYIVEWQDRDRGMFYVRTLPAGE